MAIDPITQYILQEKVLSNAEELRRALPKFGPPPDILPFDFKQGVSFDNPHVKQAFVKTFGANARKNFDMLYGTSKGGGDGNLKMMLITGVVILVASVSFMLYRRYMSKAAKACSKLKGNNKTRCMELARKEANKIKVLTLQKNKKLCSNTKNPKKCIDKLNKKIHNLSKKIKEQNINN